MRHQPPVMDQISNLLIKWKPELVR